MESIRSDMGVLDEQALDLYGGHLNAGEDELAWEVLVMAADAHRDSAHIWERLVDAAQAMQLDPDDEISGSPDRLAMQHRPT